MLAGCVIGLLGWVTRLQTPVKVELLGGHLRWEVAGSSLSVPFSAAGITGLRISTRRGISSVGCGAIQLRQDANSRDLPAPGSFHFSPDSPAPVGDWWVDAGWPIEVVAEYQVELPSTFSLAARFSGRFHQDVSLEFQGRSNFSLSFRRGWLNNDLYIRDGEGRVLGAASIDPRPGDRLLALGSGLFTALAISCWVLALWALFLEKREAKERPLLIPSRFVFYVAVVAMAGFAFSQSLWMARGILGDLPHTPDEVVNLLQSRWILGGHLSGVAPSCPDLFEIPLSYFRAGRWIGHYPPAWPLMMSPGVAFHQPILIPALLHAVFIFFLALIGRRMAGEWVGLGAALFALASPLAALLFSSTLSHAGSATMLLMTLFLIIPREEAGGAPIGVGCTFLAGLAIGFAFGIRPLTALSIAFPVGVYLMFKPGGRNSIKGLLSMGAGGAIAVIPVFLANFQITGSCWRFPYALAKAPMMSPEYFFQGLRNIDTLLASLIPLLDGWLWPLAPSGLGLALAVPAILFLLKQAAREDYLLLGICASVLFSLVFVRASGLHGYGPRYLFAACAPLWLLSARAFGILSRRERRFRFPVAGVLAAVLGFWALFQLPGRLEAYRGYNDVDGMLSHQLRQLPAFSVVLVPEDNWRVWAEASPWLCSGDSEAPVVALDRAPSEEICCCFPDSRLFRWEDREMKGVGFCRGEELSFETPLPPKNSARASEEAQEAE